MGRALFEATWGSLPAPAGAAGLRPEPPAAGVRARDVVRPRRRTAAGDSTGTPAVRDRAGDGAGRVGAGGRRRIPAMVERLPAAHPPALDLGNRRRAIRPRPVRARTGVDARAPPDDEHERRRRLHGRDGRRRRARQSRGQSSRAARRAGVHERDAVGVHAALPEERRGPVAADGGGRRHGVQHPRARAQGREQRARPAAAQLRAADRRERDERVRRPRGRAARHRRSRATTRAPADRESPGRGRTRDPGPLRVRGRDDHRRRRSRRRRGRARMRAARPSRSTTAWPTSSAIPRSSCRTTGATSTATRSRRSAMRSRRLPASRPTGARSSRERSSTARRTVTTRG